MPQPEVADLYQKAVLWPFTRYNKYGKPEVGQAEEVDCRWDDDSREVSDNEGGTIQIDASVTLDRKVLIGSLMWLGEMKDLPPTRDFSQEENKPMQVRAFNESADIKGRSYSREALLSRATDTLPQDA